MPNDSDRSEPVFTDDQIRLNLDQQKKRAKELQRAIVDGNEEALRRAARYHPRAGNLSQGDFARTIAKLSDAQLIVARELGVNSWPKLRQHINQLAKARHDIAGGAEAPDADCHTVHIRCGSDIREGLKTAGFAGTFAEFSDPYCHGPVPRGENLDAVRADFISRSYGIPIEQVLARQRQANSDLRDACLSERIVLWFEHDSYDQLILARLLAYFADQKTQQGRPKRVELICIDRFPAITRFNGLGQLSPAALRLLWSQRQAVTPAMLSLGEAVWKALRDASPEPLFEIASQGTPAVPEMAAALLRHLQELPGLDDGLSLTERLTLQLLSRGPATGGGLFHQLHLNAEPLPYLGDLMYWSFLRDLNNAQHPPLRVSEQTRQQAWPQRLLSLTEVGEDLLHGRADFQTIGALPRWVGGIEISGAAAAWRWDPNARRPVLK